MPDLGPPEDRSATADVLERIRRHRFAEIRGGRTIDPQTGQEGIADLGDDAWSVRQLAIRDLVRLGDAAAAELPAHLRDENSHVRHVAAAVLGILKAEAAVQALEARLEEDPDPVVRSQAALSLGQMGLAHVGERLRARLGLELDPDVLHRIELAISQTRDGGLSTEVADAYAGLDERMFRTVEVGRPAVDFELSDTDGHPWRLTDLLVIGPVVLIWVFADWCPVCHHEFRDLIDLRRKFESSDIAVATIECHDRFRCRVMTGQEQPPSYRGGGLASVQPQVGYRDRIWWPHLADPAGAVGAAYGVDPLEYVVHAEWINRPSTFVIDQGGIVRLAYRGTFWGDRPSIEETLEMVVTGRYEYEHPKRLRLA